MMPPTDKSPPSNLMPEIRYKLVEATRMIDAQISLSRGQEARRKLLHANNMIDEVVGYLLLAEREVHEEVLLDCFSGAPDE